MLVLINLKILKLILYITNKENHNLKVIKVLQRFNQKKSHFLKKTKLTV